MKFFSLIKISFYFAYRVNMDQIVFSIVCARMMEVAMKIMEIVNVDLDLR